MKIGTTSQLYASFLPGGNQLFLPSIRKCAQMGFEAIDLNLNTLVTVKNHPFASEEWHDKLLEMRDQLPGLGAEIEQAHAPFFNVFQTDLEDRDFKMAMCTRAVKIAGELGIKWIVFHPESLYDQPSLSATKNANVERFRPLLEIASHYETTIAIENIFDPFYYTQYHHLNSGSAADFQHVTDGKLRFRRRYCTYPEELCDLVDTLSQEFPGHVGICWDTGHANETMLDQEESLRIIGKRLVCLHVNDNLGIYDDHQIPYMGTINWDSVLRGLKAAGYAGNLSYEIGISLQRIPVDLLDSIVSYALQVANRLRDTYLTM